MNQLLSNFGLYLPTRTVPPRTDLVHLEPFPDASLDIAAKLRLKPDSYPVTHSQAKFEADRSSDVSFTCRTTIPPAILHATADADARLVRFLKQWRINPGHIKDEQSPSFGTHALANKTAVLPRWMFVHKIFVMWADFVE